jgi:acyl carrier protein
VLHARLREAFVNALDLAPDTKVETLGYRQHKHWDSLGHMALVVAIEEAFGVELTAEQVIGMDSFESAVTILVEHGVDR